MTWWRILLATLATIFLGAIGSGLWDVALKPLFFQIVNITLFISTLGIESLHDSIYKQIAKGEHYLSNHFMLSLVLAYFLVMSLNILARRRPHELRERLLANNNTKTILHSILLIDLLLLLFIVFRIVYIDEASAKLRQAQLIVNPYILENERIVFISRIAQISNRGDYSNIYAEFRKIAKDNCVDVPDVSIF